MNLQFVIVAVLAVGVSMALARSVRSNPKFDKGYQNMVKQTNPRDYHRLLLDRMLGSMDPRYSPCDEFYEYACGNYRHVMADFGLESMSTLSELSFYAEVTRMRLLGGNATRDSPQSEIKLRQFMESCLKGQSNAISASEYLKSYAKWPGYDLYWSPYEFDWMKVAIDMLYNEVVLFMPMSLGVLGEYSEVIGISFDLPDLVEITPEFIRDSVKTELSDAGLSGTYLNDMSRRLFQFYTSLHEVILSAWENLEPGGHEGTVYELMQEVPDCDLPKIISLATGQPRDWNKRINITSIEYLNGLCRLIKRSDLRTVADYMFYLAYATAHDQITTYTSLSGEDLRDYCMEQTSEMMQPILTNMYIRKYFSPESKQLATDMVFNLRRVGRRLLMETKWLDEASKLRAIKKLEAATPFVAYPDYMGSEEELRKMYAGIEISPWNYFKNALHLRAMNGKSLFQHHGNSTAFLPFDTLKMNPHFVQQGKGALKLPVTFFQPPVFHKFNPSFVNYGAAMSVAGHEFMHNFDFDGTEYDEEGRKQSFLSPNLQLSYLFRAECFYSQFNNFRVKGTDIHIKGANTLSENVADGDGVKMAFTLFKEWMEKNPEIVLQESHDFEALQLTHEQAFFVSFAQMWCDERSEAELLEQVDTDEHSPALFRVLGAVANSAEFTKAFDCPADFKLNPRERCHNFFD